MQPELLFEPSSADLTIQQRFALFHIENPYVYQELVRLIRQAKKRGFTKLGIKTFWEVMRWHMMLRTSHDGDFKLNDHFTSRYARLIMKSEADLSGVFELRELRTP